MKLNFFILLAFKITIIFGQIDFESTADDDNGSNQYSNNSIPTSVNEIIYNDQFKKITGTEKVKNNALILMKNDGQLISYNLHNLKENWNFKFKDSSFLKMDNRFRIEKSILYATSSQIELVALNINDGSLYWKSTIGFRKSDTRSYMIDGQALPIKDNMIFIASCNSNLYAFNKLTGNFVWNYELQFPYNNFTPVIHDDYLIIPNAPWVYCFEATSGKPIWQRGFGDKPMYALAQIDTKRAYVADESNKIYALNLANNAAIEWEYQTDYDYAAIKENTILEKDIYYFAAKTGREKSPSIIALNSKNGEQLWKIALDNGGNEVDIFNKFENYILGCTNAKDNFFYLVDITVGKQLKIEAPKEKPISNIVKIDNENVAFLTNNYFVTFNLKNKTFLYKDFKNVYKKDDSNSVYIQIVKANL